MNNSTQRFVIAVLAILLVLAVGAALFLYMRDRPLPLPQATLNEADANMVDPYRAEMGCIDQVLQRNDLEANQAQAMLGNCRTTASGTNQSEGR